MSVLGLRIAFFSRGGYLLKIRRAGSWFFLVKYLWRLSHRSPRSWGWGHEGLVLSPRSSVARGQTQI